MTAKAVGGSRIDALDFSRVIAMLAVVMIHVSAPYIYCESGFSLLGMNPAFILNMLSRFAVPLFVLISGISLGLDGGDFSASQFFKKRFLRIVIPYLVWGLVYELDNQNMDFAAVLRSPGHFLINVALGRSASHLYFVIILLQLYILYPLLRPAVRRAPSISVLCAFLITLPVQVLYNSKLTGLIPASAASYLWELFPAWIFYFVLGMALTRERLARVIALAYKYAPWLMAASVFYGLAYTLISRNLGHTNSLNPALDGYTVLMLLFSFSLWRFVSRSNALRKLTEFTAKLSMGVYFCHIFVLRQFREIQIFSNGMRGMLLLYLATTLISLAAAAAFRIVAIRISAIIGRQRHI